MADIKQIYSRKKDTTYNIKDEVARTTKQDKIDNVTVDYQEDGGSPDASAQFEGGTLAFAMKNLKMKFSELTEEEKKEITGPKGDAGDSAIFDPSTGNISTMKQTTGDDALCPMSQKGVTDKFNEVCDFTIREIDGSVITYNAHRITDNTWYTRNDSAANPSDGWYINVVKYRGMRVVLTPQEGKKVRCAFTKNIRAHISSSAAVGDYEIVDGTNVTADTAVLYAGDYDAPIYPADADTAIEAIVPNDCNYLWVSRLYAASGNIAPASISIIENKSLNDVAEILREEADARVEQTTGQSTTQVMSQKATTDAINEISYGKLKEIDTSTIKSNAGRIYQNTWYRPQSSGSKSNGYIMPIDEYRGCKAVFTPKEETLEAEVSMRIAFCTAPYVEYQAVQYCQGTSLYTSKEAITFDVPDDANYLWIGVLISSVDCRPQKVEFYGRKTAEDLAKLEGRVSLLEEKDSNPTMITQAKFSEANVSLLHFSDIHADALAMEAIRGWADEKGKYIDDILNTGDTVLAYYGDADAWTNIKKYGLDQALFAVGNHDRRTTSGYKTVPVADAYATYFENVEEWGVTQPEGAAENYLMYYYKDYAAGVRLIVLDGEAQDAAQVQWLEATLANALANNLTVVIAAHYVPGNFSEDYIVGTPCGRSTFHAANYSRMEEINSYFKMGAAYPQAVQDFIDAGGKFAIWLCGHYHLDLLAYAWKGWGRNMSTDDGGNYYTDGGNKVYCEKSDILFAAINKAGMHNADSRADRSVLRHCANFVTIQPANNLVKIIRVGINIDKFLRPINVITYDYVKKEIIANY